MPKKKKINQLQMRKNKKEAKQKKKEKLQIQKSLQEQIAKNAEDNKNISE